MLSIKDVCVWYLGQNELKFNLCFLPPGKNSYVNVEHNLATLRENRSLVHLPTAVYSGPLLSIYRGGQHHRIYQ